RLAVKTRRMAGAGTYPAWIGGGKSIRRNGGRAEAAIAVKRLPRGEERGSRGTGEQLVVFRAAAVAFRSGRGGSGDIAQLGRAAKHLNEQARDRQVRPTRTSRHVEQHEPALAHLRSGHERRAVLQPRPDVRLVAQFDNRVGEHLPV